jgi:peptide/nickel transport system permease protein
MSGYVRRRLLEAVPTLLLITVAVFLLMQYAPGDPLARYMHYGHMKPEDLDRIRRQLGLDQPLHIQYIRWLGRWIRGDWGTSLTTHKPVREIVRFYMGNSVILAGISFGLAVLMGVCIGIIAALRQYTWTDNLLRAFSFFGLCAPVYWVGLMMIALFSTQLHWLPGGGMYSLGSVPTLGDRVEHLIMPAIAGALYSTGMYARYMRSSLLEVRDMDYIRTARGKGLPEQAVLFRHALRNALIPMVTIVALNLPWILSGSILVESIFSWPGMGRQYWVAAQQNDYPVLMSMFTIISIAVVLSNLLADIVYGFVDPRITYDQ